MKLGLNLQKSQILWFILEFLFFFICVWVRGYKTSLTLVVNNNFEDQDLVQSNATIINCYSYLLLMLPSNKVFTFTWFHAILPFYFAIYVQSSLIIWFYWLSWLF